jgi:hypothetical protein
MEMARSPKGPTVYDRVTADLPINARVAPALVDDPLEPGAKLRVARSLRDDVLGHLLAREHIDQAQYEAGRLYEKYAEQAEIGNLKAMDPTKEAVDGGGIHEPITDKQIAAVRHLTEARGVLGRRNEMLVRKIIVEKKRFKEIARSPAELDVRHARQTFIECMEELAVFWNMAGRRR